jgi:predicted ATPase
MIAQISIDNFKSLKNLDIHLGKLLYFCGPNGSGKSNFAEAFDFLSNTFRNGLAYAVAEKGGFYNICFRKQRRARGAISFTVKGLVPDTSLPKTFIEYVISFSLRTKEETIRSDFYVDAESYQFVFRHPTDPAFNISIRRETKNAEEKYVFESDDPQLLTEAGRRLKPWTANAGRVFADFVKPQANELIYPFRIRGLLPISGDIFEPTGIRVFRISTRSARLAGTPSLSGELGKHGENLPSALDRMSRLDPPAFERLQAWVRDVIPGLKDIQTRYTETKQMGLFLQESGFGNPWYAEDLSDGTLMSISLFLALLDSRYGCIVIEEPENSLHPWILRRFLTACKEVSESKQILITTQSPLVVASANPETLFLVERTNGSTHVINALQREPILSEVIQREILDLGEYWLSGGVGAVPTAPEPEDGSSPAEEV